MSLAARTLERLRPRPPAPRAPQLPRAPRPKPDPHTTLLRELVTEVRALREVVSK